MALYGIGDLHLSLGCDKPMDIFSGWDNHAERLEANWKRLIKPSDDIVLMGDFSWGMSLEEAKKDFAFVDALPGRKILLKGNHDYWWTTITKMRTFMQENSFDSIHFLHNNSFCSAGVAICGTRGWGMEAGDSQDAKVLGRELGRLRASLQAAKEPRKFVFLHYPPLTIQKKTSVFTDLLHEFQVEKCFYGHLHGVSHKYAVQGTVDEIEYSLLSADAVLFAPVLLSKDEELQV